ncbi:MAG: hypothetical protein J6O62_00615 [Bacilli bacterium]|nr:hypothetical protein [Bacilli bacterium]
MKNIMEILNKKKNKLFAQLDKNPANVEIVREITDINNLIDSINIVLSVGIRPSRMTEEEFEEFRTNIYKEPLLDPLMPLIKSMESIKENENKELIYEYIDSKLTETNLN